MKKVISCIFLCLCIISLYGCGKHKESISQSAELNNSGTKEITQPTEIPDPASDDLIIPENKESPVEEIGNYEDCFDDMEGCAVFYSPDENKYTLYNKDMCNKQVSPCSTFKVISALIGLKNGIINSEDSRMGYNGTQYPVKEWNSDLTLQEAFRTSCVWYFRKIIDGVGKDEVQKELDALTYGNCDISEWEGNHKNQIADLNGFWLESSLKISPKEQVDILTSIFSGETEYSADNIKLLKTIMKIDDSNGLELYGKTGTGTNGNAWFIGFFETAGAANYFAIYLDDEKRNNISGTDAKKVAQAIIEKYYAD